jgi:type II protein arginine methyltransferase
MPVEEEQLLDVKALLKDAMTHHSEGELESAERYYLYVISQNYRKEEVLPLLSGVQKGLGKYAEAIATWNEFLSMKPDHLIANIEKGLLLHSIGDLEGAIACFSHATEVSPSSSAAAINLAVALSEAGRTAEAFDYFRRAEDIQPNNIHVKHQIRRMASQLVPFWHVPMLNDDRRNRAFEAAISRAVEDAGNSALVLDIGAGSGLLAMMAARAGSTNVVSCEMVPVIASTAQEIVRLNGFETQIQVVGKASKKLTVGEELARPADILVSEILSSDLLAENVIETFEDAHGRLLREDAIVIPRRASAVGCLVESAVLSQYAHVGEVCDFDVSLFNRLAPQRLPIHGTMTSWKRLSADVELVTIDLTRKKYPAELQKLSVPVLADGTAIGIVQWLKIELAQDVVFDNHPDTYFDGGWLQVLHTFSAPIQVRAGQTFDFWAGHDRNSLIVAPVLS